MPKRNKVQSITADLAALNVMLERLPDDDYIGRMGFEARKSELTETLQSLQLLEDNYADVALYFAGSPVEGSHSIRTDFAAKALDAYQELVAKKLATFETGGLAQRGPVPSKDASALNIVGVAHGSFGFVLEEGGNEQASIVKTPLKEATEAANILIHDFSDPNENTFTEMLETLDRRVFLSIKKLFDVLHNDKATTRIVEGENEVTLNSEAVTRGYDRSRRTTLTEEAVELIGTLIGVVPYQKRFDFRARDSQQIISGKIGPQFGEEYLGKLKEDTQIVGKEWTAKLQKLEVKRPGHELVVHYTMIELTPLD